MEREGTIEGPLLSEQSEQMVQMFKHVNPRNRQWLEVPLPGAGCFIPSSVKWEKV